MIFRVNIFDNDDCTLHANLPPPTTIESPPWHRMVTNTRVGTFPNIRRRSSKFHTTGVGGCVGEGELETAV